MGFINLGYEEQKIIECNCLLGKKKNYKYKCSTDNIKSPFYSDYIIHSNKTYYYDGKQLFNKLPKIEKNTLIVTENIPRKVAKELLENEIKIFRVHQNLIAKYRESKGIEKSDKADVKLIYDYYQLFPEKFKIWVGDPRIKTLYNTFKEFQKVRVATSNRLWSNVDEFNKNFLQCF